MGNQLVGVAPSQIFPVEHYLTGSYESNLQYETGMGSTRFLKVARARSDDGPVVVKVFVKHDPSFPLEQHIDKIEYIKKNLANAVNCLPFQRVLITERACLIIREFVKHSLYDRVSTRPFLTLIEKKWITFQILCALHQCHKQKIYHGDIKLENIMITSWNWILLSDFASFKPTYLPEDNPADYSFFFDTSRRRTCYIAPERFVKSATVESLPQKPDGPLVAEGPCYTGNLQPEMDIFSAGCALLELWTEGTAPFEFSQLLTYRRGEVDLVNKHLDCIEDERLKSLLQSMLSINPKERKSAEIYLDQERGKLFPEYFYSFLQSYLQMFSTIPVVPADEKISRLHSDIDQIIKIVTEREDNSKPVTESEYEQMEQQSDNDGLILITAVVSSCFRGLKFCSSKLASLEILQKLAQNTTSETILDRILPYILHLAQDSTPRVRVCALNTLTQCLGLVKNLQRSDANVFPDYILPALAPLATDNSTMVRVAYAKNIASLAETAVGFLEQSQFSCSSENHPPPHYETELSALHEMLHQTVLSLLTDSQPIVKQMLMESGITKLCVFFGRQKANDVILSHMITFLNDKEDRNLRGSFFDCITGVAAFVGWHCSPMLIPLLQQGLSDPEEFVIAKAIRATTALIELGLIQKPGIIEFIAECACYLNHPNLWIRHEICGLISTSARVLSALDVQCKIMPSIANHLKAPLIQVEKPELLMDCLLPPIPRNIYDAVIKCPDINRLIEVLRERKVARSRCSEGFIPQYGEVTTQMKNLFRRLANEGLTDLIEAQLLSMSAHLIKLHRYKLAEARVPHGNGRISLDKRDIVREVVLCEQLNKMDIGGGKIKQRKSESDCGPVEWQHMFTAIDSHSPSPTSPSNESVSSVMTAGNLAPPPQSTPTSSLVEYSMPERTAMQEKSAECRLELESLMSKMKSRYASYAVNKDLRDPTISSSPLPSGWKMNGTIVAHLHEHKAAVSRMTTLKPYGSLFASASIDGTVRLWDCNKLDGQQSINRSRQSYHANTPLHAIAACDAGQSLAIAGKDGALLLLKIDTNSSKMALQQARHLDSNARIDRAPGDPQDDGPVVEMQPLDQGAQSVIVYATLYGGLVGWDIRMPGHAWRLESDLRKGVITSFCVDPTSSWLTVGTSSGRHICWDLRFRLPIAEIKHPHDSRIRRVAPHPTEPSWLISASQGNNEVYVWNIETGHRQQAFWASSSPPLSNSNVSSHSVCALLPGVVDGGGFLLTGGTDQRIRYWDPINVENCSLVVSAPRDYLTTSNICYESRLIDGTRVVSEIHYQNNSGGGVGIGGGGIGGANSGVPDRGTRTNPEDVPRSGPEMPAPGHHDVISDMLMCRTAKQTFVVSSSRDGVIKLWK
ncbi:phosphoinositide 3-kinase regulatory subunit 4 [Uranotaenia lowii]|uniref:phosphoinositide 3-kinase regulatory subunit 4 n=1 Tax=Uranotaenia lowii TaxID=190385 RepID=UPI0024799D34|nr:phosphoinositide 3-kinase regulatory subunit 4 [Uranotaenia lowii]